MQNFVAIGLGVSAPQILDFAVPLVLVFRSFWFFNKSTAYTPRIVVGTEVPFWGSADYI